MFDRLILPSGHSRPWLFAHRGTTTLAPEHTIAAFELAASAEAEVFEIDIRLSRDSQLMVTHDSDLVRTTNGKGLVAEHTAKELKSLDAGYRYHNSDQQTPWRGKGLTLLTLAELFAAFPNTGINIDIKDPHHEAVTQVAKTLRKLNDGRWLNVGSFHPKTINAFRAVAPEISTAASQWDVAALYFGRFLPTGFKTFAVNRARGQVLQIPTRWKGLPLDSAKFITQAQTQQKHVMYWTINDSPTMQILLERGANGIVSDEVTLARKAIDQFSSKQF